MQAENVTQLNLIESKPKGAKEPRLEDAQRAVNEYLSGKPIVELY